MKGAMGALGFEPMSPQELEPQDFTILEIDWKKKTGRRGTAGSD